MKKFEPNLLSTGVNRYIEDLFPVEDEIIDEMNSYAEVSEVPVVGCLVGRLLYQLVLISKAKQIFELGSGFGYSAYWLAKALKDGGKIICTDYSEDHKVKANYFFNKAGLSNKMEFITGNSLTVLDNMERKFDIIFNDVDKEFYPAVFDLASRKLNSGGLLITDNALWYGRVVENDSSLPSTEGVKRYNELISKSKEFYSTVIPIRDGLAISVRLD